MNLNRPVTKILFLFLLLTACNKPHHTVTRGFYYWKTSYKPTAYEVKDLKRLDCSRVYLRLFDVDWDYAARRATPVAPIRLPDRMDTAFGYVAVVFITQRTLAHINDTALPALAKNIGSYISGICVEAGIDPNEIQIDCDWSTSTKNTYFALLSLLRQQPAFAHKTLSCTLRMHQVKYVTSNGIPPVDRGMVMCYNMGDMKKYGTQNSILDLQEAKEYFRNINTYPLKLDIALPLFQWCLLFQHKQFKGILRDVQPTMVTRNDSLFAQKEDNLYSCKKDTLWHGYYLKRDDVIRVERPSYTDIRRLAIYTDRRVKNNDMNVVFFDCDSITLSKYPLHDLETIFYTYQ